MLYRLVLNDEVLGEEFEADSEAEKAESIDEIVEEELEYTISDERCGGIVAVSYMEAEEGRERMAAAAKVAYEKFAQENHLYLQKLDADKNVIHQEELNLAAILYKRFEFLMDGDNSTIDDLAYAASCVEKFLEEGSWHYAMMDGNKCVTNPLEWGELNGDEDYAAWEKDGRKLDPIIWYGFQEEPDDSWYICRSDFVDCPEDELSELDCFDDSNIYKFMFYEEDYDIWPLIFDDYDDDHEYWAHEAGVYPPSGDGILEDCPIALDLDDTGEEIMHRIDAFFLKVQQQTMVK